MRIHMDQINFLYNKFRDISTQRLDNEYEDMMNDKVMADCKMLKISL